MTTNICRFLKFHILSKQLSAAFNVSEAANAKKNGTEDGKRVKPTDISKNKIPEE